MKTFMLKHTNIQPEHNYEGPLASLISDELDVTTFTCGCIYSNRSQTWYDCPKHEGQERTEDCRCLNVGLDDGGSTCWDHHDCRDGSCTHGE